MFVVEAHGVKAAVHNFAIWWILEDDGFIGQHVLCFNIQTYYMTSSSSWLLDIKMMKRNSFRVWFSLDRAVKLASCCLGENVLMLLFCVRLYKTASHCF